NISARKISPVLIIAQMIRASLLASATATRRAGFFARSALIQSASVPLRLLTLRSSEVAERTSSFLMSDIWLIVGFQGPNVSQKSGPVKKPAVKIVKDIRRATRRQFSA